MLTIFTPLENSSNICYNDNAMYKSRGKEMSFDFSSNNINHIKAHSAYKDGSGMGGGGMYFNQRRKRKDQPDDDIFDDYIF